MPPAAPAPRRIQRLATLSTVNIRRVVQPPPVAPVVALKKACCDESKIEDEDGTKICKNCYTQISESNIVSDITFSEDARGAATVQGGYISENARHARTLGSAAYRRVGGEKNSIQEIEANGRRELASLCPRLSIPETVSMQAAAIWSLAAKNNFTAGRRTDEVIAACLYAACRRQKENTVLLMDISEQQKINVFRLGEVYKDLCKELFLDNENQLGFQRLVEIEPLILKYCRNLEFGEMTRQVADDAVKIIRRMKRDWITTGRHPAGLCGGAIILAARMNNFRRTVREIVYVSKVADITVAKRVEEFRRTKSAALTVDQFRQYGPQLKEQHDPPSMYLAGTRQEKLEARKRKRQAYHERRESTAATESTVSEGTPAPSDDDEIPVPDPKRPRTETAVMVTPPATAPEPRIDADGFTIPSIPRSASQQTNDTATTPTPKSGRKKRELDKPEPVTHISQEELDHEQELEHEIEEVLENPEVIGTRNDIERAKIEERAKLLAEEQKRIDNDKINARRNSRGITWFPDRTEGVEVTEDDLEAEFANDPEVMNCRLSDEEVRAKEKIWVAFNEDWLRTQHEKELLAKINESSGRKEMAKKGGKDKKKRRGRIGDGSLLAEASTPIETPADANAAMLAKRAPVAFSRYVNYEALSKVYGRTSRANSEAPTQASSQAGSPPPRDVSPGSNISDDSPQPERRVSFAATAGARRPPAPPNRRANLVSNKTALPTPAATQAERAASDDENAGADNDEEVEEENNEFRQRYGEQYNDDDEDEDDYRDSTGVFGAGLDTYDEADDYYDDD